MLASTVAEIGTGGPRAFSRAATLPLAIVPLDDPSHLRVGATLRLQLRADGAAVPRLGVEVKSGRDSTVSGSGVYTALTADAEGVVRIPLTRTGPWLLRTAWVAPAHRMGRVSHTRVWRSTYVWQVRPRV